MNDFDRMLDPAPGHSLTSAALELAEAPCGPIGMESPDWATLEAFASAGRRELHALDENEETGELPMAKAVSKNTLSVAQREALLETLRARFEKNMARHRGLDWSKVQARLEAKPDKLRSLHQMEETGGEPDVVSQDKETGEYLFFDCAAESPKDRRSLCYDREALNSRKEAKPKSSAVDMAAELGVELLTEEQYFELQELGEFDLKTSSWLKSPAEVRKLGGAIFGDRRFDRVFIYHNGAESYYAARGFRGTLRV